MSAIEETKEKLKKVGYLCDDRLAKLIHVFEEAGKSARKSLPTIYLEGPSGAGKTYLAECFKEMIPGAEKVFVQCFPRMGVESFQYDVNMEKIIKNEADECIKPGVLLRAINQSYKSPVVLILDEIDKARAEVDSFLLDFLENGRLTTGTDTYERGEYPIYTFITSNGKRQVDENLINRSKRIEVPRPSKEIFLQILGLPSDHYLSYVYEKCPSFSVRQAKKYLEDLKALEIDPLDPENGYDSDILGQYINLSELGVESLSDINKTKAVNPRYISAEVDDLQICRVNLSDLSYSAAPIWARLLKDRPEEFEVSSSVNMRGYSNDPKYSLELVIRNINQLLVAKEYGVDNFRYDAWFECDPQDKRIGFDKMILGSQLDEDSSLGLIVKDESFFPVLQRKGKTYIRIDSDSAPVEKLVGISEVSLGGNDWGDRDAY